MYLRNLTNLIGCDVAMHDLICIVDPFLQEPGKLGLLTMSIEPKAYFNENLPPSSKNESSVCCFVDLQM